jgi:hypothetical protein
MRLRLLCSPFNTGFDIIPLLSILEDRRQNWSGGRRKQTLLVSLHTSLSTTQDSEISPAAASSDEPAPWPLVPGPVAGVGRADREVSLTRSVDELDQNPNTRGSGSRVCRRILEPLSTGE